MTPQQEQLEENLDVTYIYLMISAIVSEKDSCGLSTSIFKLDTGAEVTAIPSQL